MFTALLSLIPLVGTVVTGVSNYLSTRNEMKMSKDKNDLEEVRIRLEMQRKDFRLQLQQDMILFPFSLWCAIYLWGRTVALQYPDLLWKVESLEPALFWACLAFLFSIPIRDKFTK